jgi:hypothetical protein
LSRIPFRSERSDPDPAEPGDPADRRRRWWEADGSHPLLIPLCVLLIGISFYAQVSYLSRTAFLCSDEAEHDLYAGIVRARGWEGYAAEAFGFARQRGRVQVLFSWCLYIAPYFLHSDLQRALVIAPAEVLSWVCLAWFLAWYVNKTDAWVLVALIGCLLPYLKDFWPVSSFPLAFSVPVALFFAGMGLYLRAGAGRLGRWRGRARALAIAALFLSSMVYENMTLAWAAIAAVCLWHERGHERAAEGRGGWRWRMSALLRRDWPCLAAFAASALLYAGFRLRFPSEYEGNMLGSLTNIRAVWNVVWRFALTGQPGVNFFVRADGLAGYWVGSAHWDQAVPFVLANLSLAGALKCVLGAGAVYLWGKKKLEGKRLEVEVEKEEAKKLAVKELDAESGRGRAGGQWRRDAAIPVLGVVLAFLVQTPLAITAKYQALAEAWAPYCFGYLSFLSMTVAFWGGARWLRRALSGKPAWARSAAFGSLGAGLLVVMALNGIANQGTFRKDERHYAPWRLINALVRSDAFRDIPEGSVIVAPSLVDVSLWNTVPPNWWIGRDGYWSDYVATHSGRHVVLAGTSPARPAEAIRQKRLYYGEIRWIFDGQNAVLLLAPITERQVRLPNIVSLTSELYAIADRDYKGMTVTGAAGATGAMERSFPFEFGFEHGAYVARVKLPEMVAGSWRLGSQNFVRFEERAVDVVFERGFAGPESANGIYWQWSNGADGTGAISLVNHGDAPLRARLAMKIRTSGDTPTPFDLVVQGRPESVRFRNGESFERVLTLQPGDNEIRFHSRGPRLAAPGDPRYIVFGLEGWTVSAVEGDGK